MVVEQKLISGLSDSDRGQLAELLERLALLVGQATSEQSESEL